MLLNQNIIKTEKQKLCSTSDLSSKCLHITPLSLKNKVLYFHCTRRLKWPWSGALRVTECPFVQSEEGVLLSVFICMCVCVLNDPCGGTNVPLRACGQMDGRGESATDTEDWGSSVAAATWPASPFICTTRPFPVPNKQTHKLWCSKRGQRDGWIWGKGWRFEVSQEWARFPSFQTAPGLICTQIFLVLVYLQIEMPKADKSTETERHKYRLCGWEKETPWSW